jgi:hypothetical protein
MEQMSRFNPPVVECISLAEAVEYAGSSRSVLFAALQGGKLQGIKRAGRWLTTREAVDAYFRQRQEDWLNQQDRIERGMKIRARWTCRRCGCKDGQGMAQRRKEPGAGEYDRAMLSVLPICDEALSSAADAAAWDEVTGVDTVADLHCSNNGERGSMPPRPDPLCWVRCVILWSSHPTPFGCYALFVEQLAAVRLRLASLQMRNTRRPA